MRRSCEAAATSWRRASSIWRRERSSIARRTASPAARAAPTSARRDEDDLRQPHPVRDGDRGGPGQEGARRAISARAPLHGSQPVADAPDRLDEARLGGVVAELGAQAADVDGDGAGVVEEGEVPDRLHQLVAREDLAGVSGEVGEQVELALGQRDLLAVEGDRPHRGLDPQRPDLDRRRRLLRPCGRRDPAQHRVDAGDQLGGREGLDHVVVGAAAQADEAVGLLAARGEQDHRRPAGRAARAAAPSPRSRRSRAASRRARPGRAVLASASRSASGPSAACSVSKPARSM